MINYGVDQKLLLAVGQMLSVDQNRELHTWATSPTELTANLLAPAEVGSGRSLRRDKCEAAVLKSSNQRHAATRGHSHSEASSDWQYTKESASSSRPGRTSDKT